MSASRPAGVQRWGVIPGTLWGRESQLAAGPRRLVRSGGWSDQAGGQIRRVGVHFSCC